MEVLRTDQIAEFLERFCCFSDSVVRRVEIDYRCSGRPTTVYLVLSIRDGQKPPEDQWVDLHLRIKGVDAFSFNEGPSTWQVVFEGAIFMRDDHIVINLDDDPEPVPKQLELSKFYASGTSIEWTLEETTRSI